MSYDLPPDPERPRRPVPVPGAPSPRSRALLVTLAVFGFLAVAFLAFAGFYTDLLWYRSVGFSRVFTTQIGTRIALFALFGLGMALAVGFNLWLAYRSRPAFRGLSPEQQSLDRYRVAVDPYRRGIVLALLTILGLLAGASAAAQWQAWLLFRHSKPFGSTDAQFGVDLSFFAFRLPFWQFLVAFGFAVIVMSLLGAVAVHYLYGGLRLQSRGERTTRAARNHIAVLLGLFVLLKAASYWLDRYALVVKDSTRISGATYTDINAVLPAKEILLWIAVISALLFFATVFTRNWMAPAIGFGLLVVSAVIIGGIYPAVVQQFQVKPSEPVKEAPYIQRNIDATRSAYQLAAAEVTEYDATGIPTPGALEGDESTVQNIRLLDPAVVAPTYKALQQIRGFYTFEDPLDVDRYALRTSTGTQTRDAVVAVREVDLAGLQPGQRNWANDHTVYTHGYGIVAAYGNETRADGTPAFFESDIPPAGLLDVAEPRVYFGEHSPPYSIVGAPDGAPERELDYPDDKSANQQKNNTYEGKGGVPVGSLFHKLLFSAKFQEGNILLSDLVNSESRILWIREPVERVEKVAPWLTLDSDPYPSVVDGRIVWIVDGYTTTNGYPYSRRTALGEATTDSLSASRAALAAAPRNDVNYIRNSVKATVDAYDGTVTLYEWDQTDPVLQAWSAAFPGTVQGFEQISPDLMAHLRYPEDLFKVQRKLFADYHVTDPQAFYSGQDFWKVPDDPTSPAGKPQPPYYLTLQMPTQGSPAFSLTTTFAPFNRDTLAAFMAVNAQPGPDYGTIRVLQLPSNTTIPGPGQVQNNFEADPDVAQTLSLLRRGGSEVDLGNLLSLPVGEGVLYVEPVYVRASTGGSSYPLLQKVLVSFGSRIGFDDTLSGALDQVFEGTSGAKPPPSDGETPPPADDTLEQALADAQKALADADAALKAGDFAAYGEAQQRLADAIERAVAASGGTVSPSPSPTASPSASAAAASFG